MKKYRVIFQPRAERDLERAYRWIAAHSPERAAKWYGRCVKAILSLDKNPQRCGIAAESEQVDEEIRELHFGRRGGKYRVFFIIQASNVHILHIRHAARKPLTPDDLKELL